MKENIEKNILRMIDYTQHYLHISLCYKIIDMTNFVFQK